MDIKSMGRISYISGKWVLEDPAFKYMPNAIFSDYQVQKGEDMRIDLVMQSLYGDYSFSDVDVLLYINNIDNPLNIREGMILKYPLMEHLSEFRHEETIANSSSAGAKSIRNQLAKLNKTTRKDENRKKFLESDYSLPPFVLKEPKPAITVEGGNIKIGGL